MRSFEHIVCAVRRDQVVYGECGNVRPSGGYSYWIVVELCGTSIGQIGGCTNGAGPLFWLVLGSADLFVGAKRGWACYGNNGSLWWFNPSRFKRWLGVSSMAVSASGM